METADSHFVRIRNLLERRPEDIDLVELLELCAQLRRAVSDLERRAVAEARELELTWQEIADALGVRRQSAYERFAASVDRS